MAAHNVSTQHRHGTKSAASCLRFWKFTPQFCESCGAIYRRNYETFSVFQSKSGPVTGDETTSKSMHNWRRFPSSNCYEIEENVRFWMWRCAVAPSEAAEKDGNICAQLHSILCTSAANIFWKIYFLYDFCYARTCSFRTILGAMHILEPISYGNVAGWLSVTAGIVSKRLNLS